MGHGSGGHARSGPPRNPYALSRPGTPADNGWTTLTVPTDPPPPWPLFDPATAAETAIWNDLWSRPQASAWPRYNLTREVAAYTRGLAEYETLGKRNAALGGLLRKQADDLGLTIVGADRNKWLLPKPETPATEGRIATVTPLARPTSGTRSHQGTQSATPGLDLLAKWRGHGATFPPESQQYQDAVVELAALGVNEDPYSYLTQQGA